jgi:hypothetical protein
MTEDEEARSVAIGGRDGNGRLFLDIENGWPFAMEPEIQVDGFIDALIAYSPECYAGDPAALVGEPLVLTVNGRRSVYELTAWDPAGRSFTARWPD